MAGLYRDIAKLLDEAGYSYEKNAKGSHEKWRCDTTGKIVIVPRNMKSKHTGNGILKDIGSDERL